MTLLSHGAFILIDSHHLTNSLRFMIVFYQLDVLCSSGVIVLSSARSFSTPPSGEYLAYIHQIS